MSNWSLAEGQGSGGFWEQFDHKLNDGTKDSGLFSLHFAFLTIGCSQRLSLLVTMAASKNRACMLTYSHPMGEEEKTRPPIIDLELACRRS